MICSSLNRFRFMSVLLERTQPYNEGVSGEHVSPSSSWFTVPVTGPSGKSYRTCPCSELQ